MSMVPIARASESTETKRSQFNAEFRKDFDTCRGNVKDGSRRCGLRIGQERRNEAARFLEQSLASCQGPTCKQHREIWVQVAKRQLCRHHGHDSERILRSWQETLSASDELYVCKVSAAQSAPGFPGVNASKLRTGFKSENTVNLHQVDSCQEAGSAGLALSNDDEPIFKPERQGVSDVHPVGSTVTTSPLPDPPIISNRIRTRSRTSSQSLTPTPPLLFVNYSDTSNPRQLLYKLLNRGPTAADHPGDAYIMTNPAHHPFHDHIKIGYSKRAATRRPGKGSCDYASLSLWRSYSTPLCKFLESLLQAEFVVQRRRKRCGDSTCKALHEEWFAMSAEEAEKAAERWQGWLAVGPYEAAADGARYGKLKPQWRAQVDLYFGSAEAEDIVPSGMDRWAAFVAGRLKTKTAAADVRKVQASVRALPMHAVETARENARVSFGKAVRKISCALPLLRHVEGSLM